MRELRFRAWDKKRKKMINFDLGSIYGYEGEQCGVVLPDGIMLNYNSGYDDRGINNELEIIQFAGLKDKNGVEICEMDVLSDDSGNLALVKWVQPNASFEIVDKDEIIENGLECEELNYIIDCTNGWVGLFVVGVSEQ